MAVSERFQPFKAIFEHIQVGCSVRFMLRMFCEEGSEDWFCYVGRCCTLKLNALDAGLTPKAGDKLMVRATLQLGCSYKSRVGTK